MTAKPPGCAAVGATANAERSILHAVWRRRNLAGRPELEAAVREAAEEPGDTDAAAALRQQIKRTPRENPQLLAELVAQLPPAGAVTITASGERSIAAQTIGTAVTMEFRMTSAEWSHALPQLYTGGDFLPVPNERPSIERVISDCFARS
ncbi:hypothetical protein [Streptomyces sp. NPDC093514]|uniref:hypothetical protein n=1 Tax=Streptomyces sp. NPDC093514 TaxID=3366039 RepID=UPI003816ECB1